MRFLIIFAFLILSPLTHAENIGIAELTYSDYNRVWKGFNDRDLHVRYDTERDQIGLMFAEVMGYFAASLDKSESNKLVALLDKYKEWNLKASQKNVKLEKSIGTFNGTMIFWKDTMNSDMEMSKPTDLEVYFFSQSPQVHQAIIRIPKLKSIKQYGSRAPSDFYLSYDQAMALRNAITEDAAKKAVVKHRNQEALESEFN